MSVMEWNEKLDIGVTQMNDQHKGLLDIMNRLHEAFEKNAPFNEQEKMIGELAAATVKHFDEEEIYMESIGFDSLEVHKIIHKDLLEKFTQHAETASKEQALNDNFFTFLRVWLTAHIMGIDAKYGALAKSQAA